MGLGDNTGRLTYLNIKKGKITYKDKNGEAKESGFIEGFITKVEFKKETYQGQEYEKANITIIDEGEKFLLQMNIDSGYFRAFCNAFKSGNPTFRTKISPSYSEKDNKKISGCFVEQNGTALKWFYNKEKDNLKDLPAVQKVRVKGKDVYDGTDQLEFWKNWLLTLKFKEEIEASSHSMTNQDNGLNKTTSKPANKKAEDQVISEPNFDPISIDQDDLPF